MNLMRVKDEIDQPDVASTNLSARWEICHRQRRLARYTRSPEEITPAPPCGTRPRQTNICTPPLVRPDRSSCKSSTSRNRLFLNNKMGFCKLRSVFNYPHNRQQMLGCHRYRPVVLLDPQQGSAVWPGFTFPKRPFWITSRYSI